MAHGSDVCLSTADLPPIDQASQGRVAERHCKRFATTHFQKPNVTGQLTTRVWQVDSLSDVPDQVASPICRTSDSYLGSDRISSNAGSSSSHIRTARSSRARCSHSNAMSFSRRPT